MPLWNDLQLRPEVHLLEELNPRPLVNREAREEAKSEQKHLRRFESFAGR
jgi:hypothetical protein